MSIRILRHTSEVLKGNACGDPFERDLWVYLPPGYEDSGERYPVLWCLVGYIDSGEMEMTGNRWSPGLAARLDRLIGEGCPPVIVAFPDCFTRWGGSQYLNSSATGRYEDYVCDELVPILDGELRTRPERGVFGKSSGGYGALRLAMRRPGLFEAVACHSGDMAFGLSTSGFEAAVGRIAAAGSVESFVEQFESREGLADSDFHAIHILAMSACYSPDPDQPFGIAFPMDLEAGQRDTDVWRRWMDHDPVEMVTESEHAEALRALRLLFLDCGNRDEWNLHLGMRQLQSRLKDLRIAHEAEEFDGGHRHTNYRYDVSIPKLARALTA